MKRKILVTGLVVLMCLISSVGAYAGTSSFNVLTSPNKVYTICNATKTYNDDYITIKMDSSSTGVSMLGAAANGSGQQISNTIKIQRGASATTIYFNSGYDLDKGDRIMAYGRQDGLFNERLIGTVNYR